MNFVFVRRISVSVKLYPKRYSLNNYKAYKKVEVTFWGSASTCFPLTNAIMSNEEDCSD